MSRIVVPSHPLDASLDAAAVRPGAETATTALPKRGGRRRRTRSQLGQVPDSDTVSSTGGTSGSSDFGVPVKVKCASLSVSSTSTSTI